MSEALLFATNNPGKLSEVTDLERQFGVQVVSLSDVGIESDQDETGETFHDNAVLKIVDVLAGSLGLDMWVAGDDSGLMIDALNGEPGVHTRRWNGSRMEDQEIIDLTLRLLKDTPPKERTGRFVSVVAMGKGLDDIHVFEGEVTGHILEQEERRLGVIEVQPLRRLFKLDNGQMLGQGKDPESSHRTKAFRKVFEFIAEQTS